MLVRANKKATFPYSLQRVWEVVTSLTNYSWRSDIEKIEVVSDTQFIETTKDGYRTVFTITKQEPCRLWEFDMENSNIKGHWTGIFTSKGNKTQIDFTECVIVKRIIMKPFVKSYLRKQQSQFVMDLKKVFINKNGVSGIPHMPV